MYRVGQGGEVDAESAPFFVESSLAPVLLFRWRIKSVADVQKGIRQHGFTQKRWVAVQRYWLAVRRHGLGGPISSLDPWDGWIPLTCMASTSGSLMPWRFKKISLGKWLLVGRMLGCIGG